MNCQGTCVLSQQLKNAQPIEEVPGIPMGLQEVKEIIPFVIEGTCKFGLIDLTNREIEFAIYSINYRFTFVNDFVIPPSELV